FSRHRLTQPRDRIEVADVVPSEVAGDDDDPTGSGGGLGYYVVDSPLLQPGPHLVEHLVVVGGVPGLGDAAESGEEGRVLLGEDLEQRGGLGDEHARVPPVASGVDICAGGAGLWLLSERLGPPGGRSSLQTEQLTGLDVAVGGCRMAGHDADGDDVAGLG